MAVLKGNTLALETRRRPSARTFEFADDVPVCSKGGILLLITELTCRAGSFDHQCGRSAALRRPVNARDLTDIYLVRHAHVHNPNDILYGRLPGFRLSEVGLEQARKLAAFLSGRNIEAIYSSPLLRARQTATVIAESLPAVPVRQSKLILEVRTGYEGKPNSILKPGFSFYEPRVAESDESMEGVYERLSKFFQRVVARHAGQAVVVVSHGDPIAILRLGLLQLPLTVSNLHSTVYPARASINLVTLAPGRDPLLTYFSVAGERV